MSQYGMDFLEILLNLHESDIEGNVQTEYEENSCPALELTIY